MAWLASLSPSWWNSAVRLEGVGSGVGDHVENAIVSQTHRAREPDETWAMAITQEQANAWLRDRLPKWASNRGVKQASASVVRVRFESDALTLGVQERAGSRVYTARFALSLRSDGSLWTTILAVSAGRMPAPARWAAQALSSVSVGSSAPPTGAFSGRLPALHKAEFRLDDVRVLRARDIRVEPGRMIIVWETASAPRDRANH